MKTYWITIGDTSDNQLFRLGIGLTAIDENDARAILAAHELTAPLLDCGVEIRTIAFPQDVEANHILPNCGIPYLRGVWFPAGL